MNQNREMIEKRSWKEFKESGLLWFINTILHLFGWAIVCSIDNEIIEVYPARTSFRGFSEICNKQGYEKVTEYLNENIKDLLKETKDE